MDSSKNDSLPLYSTDPHKPFKYGYAYNREQCFQKYSEFVRFMELKNGDVVADIGAAGGYIDGALSVICDSVTFYVEDIDERLLNKKEFDKMLNHFSKVKGSPQTNTFHFKIGTERRTGLPDGIFDKVFVYNSFHEFTYVNDMVKDITSKLKQDGKLIIYDGFSIENDPYVIKGCNIAPLKVDEVIQIMKLHGLYLTKMVFTDEFQENALFFEKNIDRSNDFLKAKNAVNAFVQKINLLDSAFVASDSIRTNNIADSLITKIADINRVYTGIEEWINEVGYDWLNEKNYLAAINVFKANMKVFPDSYNVYDSLAEAYMNLGQNDTAMRYYIKSVELNPTNSNGKEKIIQLKKIIENK